ncbi:multidrug efflux SMR transporter [Deinococcus sp. KNUC1210]|uniref:DMT family transporter n=1 Tax=Deinococcus sp. KNUC1210 TaxID=2917691 RepID=UPI001EF0C508|nr:multidrug efflux SMR transporter [Deinococcus sp. KNUC1210]ULH15145.1 multidrug efflux SMR transporter [Deinococcus sp. KNUC1210]
MNATLAFVCLAFAALLDIAANVLLKRSDGFRRPWPGIAALGLVLCAFGLLGLSLRAVPLSTAYAVWGGLGIVGAALLGRRLDGVRFSPAAWAGLALILGSVLLLHLGE